MRRAFIALAIVVGIFGGYASAVHAEDAVQVPCSDPQTGVTQRATLSLDVDRSTTDVKLRTSDHKSLALVFTPSCLLGGGTEVAATLIAGGDSEDTDFPDSAEAVTTHSDDRVTVQIRVNRTSFDPGAYGALVSVSGAQVNTAEVDVTASIKSTSWWWPVFPAAVGALAGLVAATFAAWSANPTDKGEMVTGVWALLRSPWGIAAAVVALVLTFFVSPGPYRDLYSDADLWVNTFSNMAEMSVKGFGVGAGATVVTLVAKGVKEVS